MGIISRAWLTAQLQNCFFWPEAGNEVAGMKDECTGVQGKQYHLFANLYQCKGVGFFLCVWLRCFLFAYFFNLFGYACE